MKTTAGQEIADKVFNLFEKTDISFVEKLYIVEYVKVFLIVSEGLSRGKSKKDCIALYDALSKENETFKDLITKIYKAYGRSKRNKDN